MGIIVFDNLFFNKILDNFDTSFLEVTVVFDESLERFEYVLWFVDGIILNEFFIFFYYFSDKWFYGL